jgi:hypothetical protein
MVNLRFPRYCFIDATSLSLNDRKAHLSKKAGDGSLPHSRKPCALNRISHPANKCTQGVSILSRKCCRWLLFKVSLKELQSTLRNITLPKSTLSLQPHCSLRTNLHPTESLYTITCVICPLYSHCHTDFSGRVYWRPPL